MVVSVIQIYCSTQRWAGIKRGNDTSLLLPHLSSLKPFWLNGSKVSRDLCILEVVTGDKKKNVHAVRKKHVKISTEYSSDLWRREDFKLRSDRSYCNENVLLGLTKYFFSLSLFHLSCLPTPLHLHPYYLLQATVISHKNTAGN